MALQPKLGILSERRAWNNRAYSSGPVFVRPNLAVTGQSLFQQVQQTKRGGPFGEPPREHRIYRSLPAKSKGHR